VRVSQSSNHWGLQIKLLTLFISSHQLAVINTAMGGHEPGSPKKREKRNSPAASKSSTNPPRGRLPPPVTPESPTRRLDCHSKKCSWLWLMASKIWNARIKRHKSWYFIKFLRRYLLSSIGQEGGMMIVKMFGFQLSTIQIALRALYNLFDGLLAMKPASS
jgi:hypothetical protein